MCPHSLSEKDSSSSITPPIQPRMPWRVVEVHPFANFRLRIRFVDGLEGMVKMTALIHSPTAGVFAQLAEPSRFAHAFVEHGAVTWPGEIDLPPDSMYAEIRELRNWVLG